MARPTIMRSVKRARNRQVSGEGYNLAGLPFPTSADMVPIESVKPSRVSRPKRQSSKRKRV